jgi:hypothetical protein
VRSPPAPGAQVTIYGKQLSSDCSLDATVNGRPIELNNLLPQPNGFRGLLLYRDISQSRGLGPGIWKCTWRSPVQASARAGRVGYIYFDE